MLEEGRNFPSFYVMTWTFASFSVNSSMFLFHFLFTSAYLPYIMTAFIHSVENLSVYIIIS